MRKERTCLVRAIEHVNRELERLTLDFNDVRVDVAERVKRDDEVCKELERLEKRVKEEIIAATERAQSFALMEIEPLRLENVEKIEGICEALFGLENGKMAGKDAQTIKAMTRTMFLESPRSSEMYLGVGGGGAAAVSMEMSSSLDDGADDRERRKRFRFCQNQTPGSARENVRKEKRSRETRKRDRG